MAVDAGSIYSEIRIQLDALNGDIQKVQASFDKLGTQLGQSSEKTKNKIGDNLQQINFAHIALFAAIGAYIKTSVQGYADFEQSIANVASVSRATQSDIEKLEKAASEAGETTKFSGKQAADALYFLASAGFSATQSVEALDGVLALASATQADLAFTSETVASAISQFNLEAKDATKVANVFAMGIANSQATIDKLAVSMRYVGPVANAFKFTIEDTVGVLQILYNAGFEASQAGTALRSVLADLSNAASPANDKLEKLGISFKNVNPAANSFSDIIRNLNPIATDAGKIMEVFGDRAGPVMIKLLKEGGDQIDKYTQQVTGTNQAINAANIQNDTLQFAMSRLNKSFFAVGKSIVEEFAPGMKTASNLLADLFFSFNKLPAPIKVFLGAAGAVIVALTGITTVASLLGSVLGASLLPILGITAGIAGLVTVSTILYKAYNEASDNTISLQRTQKGLETSTNSLKTAVDNYRTANEQLNDKTKTLNSTEKATLETRKNLASIEILKTLKDSIGWLEKYNKKQIETNNVIENYQLKVRNTTEKLKTYNDAFKIMQDIEQRFSLTTSIFERNTFNSTLSESEKRVKELYGSTKNLKTIIEAQTKQLGSDTQGLLNNQTALDSVKESRKKLIDELASAYRQGILTNLQLDVYNEKIVTEIKQKAAQLKVTEEQTQAQNNNNKSKSTAIALTDEEIEANKKLQKTIQKTKEDLEDLNATDLEKIELDRNRAKAEVDLLEASNNLKIEAKKILDQLYDAKKRDAEIDKREDTAKKLNDRLDKFRETAKKYNEERKKQQEIDDEITDKADDYIDKLQQLTDVNYDLLGAEEQRAIEEIEASKASEAAKQMAIKAIKEYYAALKDKTAFDTFIDNLKKLSEDILSGVSSVSNALAGLAEARAQTEIDAINAIKEEQLKAVDEQLQAQLQAAGVAELTTIEKLQKELQAAIDAGDTELAAEKQKELTKATLIQTAADNKKAIEDQAAKESAMIAYKAAHASWVLINLSTIADGIGAAVKSWNSAPWPWNLAAVAATTIGTGILIAKQAITEPQPPAMIEGGIVMGSQMRGTPVIAAENGSNELMLNDSDQGQNMMRSFARSIANEMGNGMPAIIQVILDSKILAESTVTLLNNGKYTLLPRAIAK